MSCLCQQVEEACNQGRSCPLNTRKLFWDRQQESIQRLASGTDGGDEVLSAGVQRSVPGEVPD